MGVVEPAYMLVWCMAMAIGAKKNRILDKVKGVSTDEDVDDTQQYTAHLGNIAHCLDESFSGFTEFHVFLS